MLSRRTVHRAFVLAALWFADSSGVSVADARTPAVVDDQTRSAARALTEQGLKLYDAHDYKAALDRLSRADELVRLPTTGVNLARVYAKLGKLLEASEKYLAVTRLTLEATAAPAQQTSQQAAEAERAAILPRLASLEISVEPFPSEAVVTLDGQPLARALIGVANPINPGSHALELNLGQQRIMRSVTLAEGGSQRVVLRLDPPTLPDAPPAPSATLPSATLPSATLPSATIPIPSTEPAATPESGVMGPAMDLEDAALPATREPAADTTSPSAPGPSGMPIAGVGVTALGGAGLVTAGVFGLITQSIVADLVACTDDLACPRAEQISFFDSATVAQRNMFIALGAGGGLALTGVILMVVSPSAEDSKSEQARTSLVVSPTAASLGLRW